MKRHSDRNSVLHRFLNFHIVQDDGKEFYLRVDHRQDHDIPLWVFGDGNGVVIRIHTHTPRWSSSSRYVRDDVDAQDPYADECVSLGCWRDASH